MVSETLTSSCQVELALSAAVTTAEFARVGPPTIDSHMLAGETEIVTVLRWVDVASPPHLSTGYSVAVPKSQGSSLPVTPSTFTFQLAYMPE